MRCLVLRLSTLLLAHGLPPSAADTTVKRFQVNLDQPAKERWAHVARYWSNISEAMRLPLLKMVTEHLGNDWDSWSRVADDAIQGEREQELIGMLEVKDELMGTSSNLTESKMIQLLYEMASPTSCSGVLWADRGGTVIHGRNMDYAFHFNMTDASGKTETLNWPNVTFEVLFVKGDKPLYISTMWPDSVGIATAMRYDGWAFEQNTRLSNDAKENLNAALEGGIAYGPFARDVMESTSDFEEAIALLYNASFMAPQYFVMSGSGKDQGAVLTIDRLGKHKAGTPKIHRVDSNSSEHWHLVQTNDDLTYPTLDPRRPVANAILMSRTQDQVNVDEMWKFVHSPPLKNPMTVFTTVMVPKTGYYHTILPHERAPTTASLLDAVEATSDPAVGKPRLSGPVYASVLEKGKSVKPHSHAQAAHAHRKWLLRGARPDSDSDVDDEYSHFLQVALSPHDSEWSEF